MISCNIAEAKARLSELVDESIAGGTVTLMRRGTPVARIVPIEAPKQQISLEWLQSVTAGMTSDGPSAVDTVRAMRDEGY